MCMDLCELWVLGGEKSGFCQTGRVIYFIVGGLALLCTLFEFIYKLAALWLYWVISGWLIDGK